MSAPHLKNEIRDSGIIEGGPQGFKAKEVEHLVQVLRAGSLPASLNPNPVQEEKVGPTLGEDTIAKGVFAIWVSLLVVPIFMVIYYRFAGFVAVLALLVNMILLIGSMAFIQATFSLPGLAGLALTIGMAVDANVLVFERMREEKERGASLAQQIRNGFNRAWVTIFDSHVTNFLAALVLYIVGTEQVKGFALTMMIGMAWNLFTAVFMSRVIFEVCYTKGWLKKITMLKILDKTNIDFVGPRYYCMAGSMILIVLGLIATGIRWQGMFNIDFTGGTLVTIRLNENDPNVQEPLRVGTSRSWFATRPADCPTRRSRAFGWATTRRSARFNIRTTDPDLESRQERDPDGIRPEPGSSRDVLRPRASRSPVRRQRRQATRPKQPPTAGGPFCRRTRVRADLQHNRIQQHGDPRTGHLGRLRQSSRQRQDRQPDVLDFEIVSDVDRSAIDTAAASVREAS